MAQSYSLKGRLFIAVWASLLSCTAALAQDLEPGSYAPTDTDASAANSKRLQVYRAEASQAEVLLASASFGEACQTHDCRPPACTCKQSCTTCCCGCCVDWSNVPFAIRPMPRPGNFPVPPSGPGYYSLMDCLTDTCREKRPPSGYAPLALMPPSFFDADFRYVESLGFGQRTFVEKLKRMHLNDCLMFSTGGQFWTRFASEHNSRLTEADNSYALPRVRLFGDLSFGELARVYGEFIWADSVSEELRPLPVDVNRGDLLNLFLDVNVVNWNNHPVVARVGRQELLLGSQRLISTLDWANTRRTFEGVRVFRKGEKWDLDAFWVQFVPASPSSFDRPDENQDFTGAWLTRRPQKGHFFDLYYLFLNNTNNIVREGIVQAPFEASTLGARWAGEKNGVLWDFEAALQVGNRNAGDLVAGAATAGLGRHFKDMPLKPTAWVYYDYASGDSDPNSGRSTTFNQLYPFGHYFLGWIDQVGRKNIQDANAHLFLYPASWMTVWLQYHHFWLAQNRDALYNAGGVAIRRDPTGQAGSDVGDEIDVVLNFHLTRYSDIMVGYSRLFGGGFLEQTSGPNRAADSEFFHVTFQQKW